MVTSQGTARSVGSRLVVAISYFWPADIEGGWMLLRVFAILVVGVCLAGNTACAQDALKSSARPATVEVVGSGVFALPQGHSVYIEEFNNKILLAFPTKSGKASKNAYWPGSIGERAPCSDLAADEFELVVAGEAVCVRMGLTIDTLRSIGDTVLAREYNGGCSIDVVRFEKAADTINLVARADCTELVPYSR